MLLNDRYIRALAEEQKMIQPFEYGLVRKDATLSVLSYGCSSFGYDIRLSPREFFIFRHVPGTIIDPKDFSSGNLESIPLHPSERGDYFILPGHSYGLGVALERLNMPRNVTAVCVGKSTYARAGLIVNVTPAEAGWSGHLTLEFSNASSADCKVYAGEGVCQLLFFEGQPPDVSYADRNGKYQNQPHRVVRPIV